jgi:hypothetical protein
MNSFLNFINGEYVATGKTFDKRNPATGRVIGRCTRRARPRSTPPSPLRAPRSRATGGA